MLEHYGKEASAVNLEQLTKAVPTVFIGVGGTGKQVLMRFRKRLFERHRKPRPDHSRFLLLDTDMQALVPRGERAEDYKDALLDPAQGECVKCGISPGEYDMVLKDIRYKSDPRWSWMHPKMSEYSPTSFQDGAGTIRQAGRLAFMLKYSNIRAQLIEHVRQLHDYATRNVDTVYNDRMEFVIITSLSGGTGSGMFIDLAYLIRDIFSAEADADAVFHAHIQQRHTTMIAVMPTIFTREDSNLAERFKQNGYASLLEMEYYNTPRPEDSFYAKYGDQAGAAAVEFHPPWANHPIRATAWDTCYLIDDINDKLPGQNNTAREIYQMIADYLFLDFDTNQFAVAKRSARSNHTQLRDRIITSEVPDISTESGIGGATRGKVLFANRYGCTFSSFGLAEILIDREKINRAASYRLAYLLIQRWITGSRTGMTEVKFIEMMKSDLFQKTVQEAGEAGISFFADDLWKEFLTSDDRKWLDLLQRDFDEAAGASSEDGVRRLEDLVNRHESYLAQTGADGYKGAAILTIEARQSVLAGNARDLGAAQRLLDRRIRNRFNDLGCDLTISILSQYRKALAATKKWSHDQSEYKPTKVRELLAILIDAENVPGFPFNCRKTATDHEYPRACESVKSHLEQRYRSEACRYSEALTAQLEAFVGGPQTPQAGPIVKSRYQELHEIKDILTKFSEQLSERFTLSRRVDSSTQPGDKPTSEKEKKASENINRKQPLLPEWGGEKYDQEINNALLSVAIDPKEVHKFDWLRVEEEILKKIELPDSVRGKSRIEVIRHWMKWPSDEDIRRSSELLADACYKVLNNGISLHDFEQGFVVDYLIRMEDTNKKRDHLRKIVDHSAPYLPSIPNHYINSSFPPAYVNLLGWIAGDEIRREERDSKLHAELNGISLEQRDGSPRDSIQSPNATTPNCIALVREMTGVPLNYYLRLPELKNAYESRSIVDYRYTCHIDAKDVDLPDIDLIIAREEQLLRENSPVILRAFVLRWIRFEDPLFVIEVPSGGAGEPERKPLGKGLTRIIKRACLDAQVCEYLMATWRQWKNGASAVHLAVLYSALQQTLKLFPEKAGFGFSSNSPPPLQNCFVKVINELTLDLIDKGPEGVAWHNLLKMRSAIHDLDYIPWKDGHDRISKYIRETCLRPASSSLPVWQIDLRAISKIDLKTAQDLAVSPAASTP